MGTGDTNKKHKPYQEIVDLINSSFQVSDFEFGNGKNVEKLCNTQIPGVYILKNHNIKDCDIEIEIRVKPKQK